MWHYINYNKRIVIFRWNTESKAGIILYGTSIQRNFYVLRYTDNFRLLLFAGKEITLSNQQLIAYNEGS